MKTSIKVLFALLFMIPTVSGALVAEQKNKPEIMTVDNYIAVFDFEVTTGDKGIARPLTESVRREIVLSGKYKVIDRGNMEKILGEQKLQMSGCVTGECIVEAGQLLGVGKLISGTVSMVGKTYYLTLSLISVRTGEIENVADDKCKCEVDELLDSTKRLAKKLLGVKVEQQVATVPEQIPTPIAIAAHVTTALKQETVNISKLTEHEPEPKITNSIGMTFVYIKPGTFMMGSPSGELGRDDDEIQHQVTLTRGFYMQITEVTQGQWRAVMGNNPSRFSNCGDDCPVEQVSWNDVQEFILRLNQKEGGNSYHLPTEAEWEYACRAGTNTMFSFGDNDSQLINYAWFEYNSGKNTHSVARKNPNAWGLYDMLGNVWEWCQDWLGNYPSGSVTDPAGLLSGLTRVYRGGGWYNYAVYCRSANRYSDTPVFRSHVLGFRLSRTPLSEKVGQPVATVESPATLAIPKQSELQPTTKETARDGRFIAYDNGTVLDTRTNLMWAAKDNGNKINWVNAKSYCENYRGGGYTDWRMPTQDELAGLYDAAKTYKSDCGYDVHLAELIRLTCTWAWASETSGSDAAFFGFFTGERGWYPQSYDGVGRALPVRSGK